MHEVREEEREGGHRWGGRAKGERGRAEGSGR